MVVDIRLKCVSFNRKLWVLSSSMDIAPIFAEVFSFEQRFSLEINMQFNKFISYVRFMSLIIYFYIKSTNKPFESMLIV